MDSYTYEDLKSVIKRNQRIMDIVGEDLGPLTMSEVTEMFEISYSAIKYALDRGSDLSNLSRGRKRDGLTGREIVESITERVPMLSEKEYAERLRTLADKIEQSAIFAAS
jgi:hypothetical protein